MFNGTEYLCLMFNNNNKKNSVLQYGDKDAHEAHGVQMLTGKFTGLNMRGIVICLCRNVLWSLLCLSRRISKDMREKGFFFLLLKKELPPGTARLVWYDGYVVFLQILSNLMGMSCFAHYLLSSQ